MTNSDSRILHNQKLITNNMCDKNCRSCVYYKNKNCVLYIPNENLCLILKQEYSNE